MTAEILEVTNPGNGNLIDTVRVATPTEIENALVTGTAGSRAWSRVPAHSRVDSLLRFAQLLLDQQEGLARLLALESGKTLRAARREIAGAATKFVAYGNEALRLYGVTIPGDRQAGYEHDVLFTRREPYGLAVIITPFNFPISLFTDKVAPALATGNSVIVKPSEFTPLTTTAVVGLLHEAGVPPEACQIVHGGGEVGAALVSSPLVRLISATGSTQTGVRIATAAARYLSRVKLELGGNDPLIVLPDADIETAVEHAVIGRIADSGQCCAASKRFLVHESRAEEFSEQLCARLAPLRVGDQLRDDTDIGPLIHTGAAQNAAAQVSEIVAGGGRLALGDGSNDNAYFAPQVIVDVTADAAVAHDEEIFAPVFPVISYSTDSEAISIANSSSYGLQSSVFSRDLSHALRVAYELEAGLVAINGTGNYKPNALSFGGYKMSGLGREGLTAMADEYTQVKTIGLRGVLRPTEIND